MRLALNATGEVGTRTGLILLAERSLDALGIYGGATLAGERRVRRITDLTGFDLLVTDDPSPAAIAAIAAEDGISCVVAGSVPAALGDRFAAAGRTVLAGADLSGIASTLAAHEAVVMDAPVTVSAAWTVPGTSLRRGVGVGFPDPVGARWGRPAQDGVEVPMGGSWAGASVTVRGTRGGRPVERLLGVADQRDHLLAIALAAGAIAVADGEFPAGLHRPADRPVAYLGAALRVGLGVASHTA